MESKRTDIELAAAALEAARLADKELFNEKVKHEREMRETHEKNTATALDLQAVENHRRFDALNHEAEQLKKMQATYFPREVAESRLKEVDDRMDVLRDFQSNLTGRLAVVAVVIVIVAGVIGGVLGRVFFR